jgi:hypothetical protein
LSNLLSPFLLLPIVVFPKPLGSFEEKEKKEKQEKRKKRKRTPAKKHGEVACQGRKSP